MVADGELAPVGPPEGDVVLRTFRPEAMVIALAVPEAAPAALGAGRAEEGASGLDDPHRTSLAEWIRERLVSAVSRESLDSIHCQLPEQLFESLRRVELVPIGVLDVAALLPDQALRLHQRLAGHGNRPRFPEKGCECAPR